LRSLHGLRQGSIAIVVLLVLIGLACGRAPLYAQSGSATSSAIPSSTTPSVGEQIEVAISIDVTDVDAPDEALGSFSGSLDWDPAVLAYDDNSGILAGFTGVVNDGQASSGHLIYNGAKATGATGSVTVLTITFDVVGSGSSPLDLNYSAMAAAHTFKDLLPLLTIQDGQVEVGSAQSYSLTIAVDPAEGGTTDPGVGVHTYPEGTAVDITAMPSASYGFDRWSGACTGDGSCQVTMDGDKAVTAHFVELPQTCYLLTLGHTGEGSDPVADPTHSMDCGGGRYVAGEAINVSGAVPAPGWRISGWIGTSQDDSTADTNFVTMPAGNHTVSVIYKVYVYLPLSLRGTTTGEVTLWQPGVEESNAIAPLSLNANTEALDDSRPGSAIQEIAGGGDAPIEPRVIENAAAVAPPRTADGRDGLDSDPSRIGMGKPAGEENLPADPENSDGGHSRSVVDDGRMDDHPAATEQLWCTVPPLVVVGVLTSCMLKDRSTRRDQKHHDAPFHEDDVS
jgi:hypothetical protein